MVPMPPRDADRRTLRVRGPRQGTTQSGRGACWPKTTTPGSVARLRFSQTFSLQPPPLSSSGHPIPRLLPLSNFPSDDSFTRHAVCLSLSLSLSLSHTRTHTRIAVHYRKLRKSPTQRDFIIESFLQKYTAEWCNSTSTSANVSE